MTLCLICNKKTKRNSRKYCSLECRNIAYRTLPKYENKFGKNFYKGGRQIRYTCQHCGLEFMDFITNKRKYCSTSCASSAKVKTDGKNWKGGTSPLYAKYDGKFTKEIKQRVLERDKVCQDCGGNKTLQCHHIDFNPKNGSIDNLVLLCKSCHGKRHASYSLNRSSSSSKNSS